MTEFDEQAGQFHPGQQPEPSEYDIFVASDGFDPQNFAGIDAFAPGGPAPMFGARPTPAVPAVSCADVQRNLQLYLDSELVAAQQLQISSHLSRCLACQGAQLFQTRLRTVVAQKALDPMPAGMRERITRALGIQ